MPENESGEGRSNPNVYTSFTARKEVTLAAGVTSTNTTVMLTNVNMVLFCGDFTSQAAGLLLTLPEGFRPANAVRLPVIIAGQSSSQQEITIEIPPLDVSISKTGSITATGSVPAQQGIEVTVNVPEMPDNPVSIVRSGTIAATGSTTPVSDVAVDVTVTTPQGSDVPWLVSGGFDDSGELESAYVLPIVNNTKSTDMTASASVDIPSTTVEVEVTDGTTLSGSTTIPAQSVESTIDIPQHPVDVTVADNTKLSGTTPAQQVTASVSVPSIGTLLISPDGSVSCDVPGTICTNGMAFSINDNWY